MRATRRPHLADRRRLVIYSQRLMEEGGSSSNRSLAVDGESRRNTSAYGWRVHRRLRARWYGLVPVKRRAILAIAAVLFAIVTAAGVLHWCALWWEPLALHAEIARPFRLDRPDSFGAWLGTFISALTAGVSLLIYQLRRYKADDYHGHYRIWRYAMIFSLVASIDCISGLISWLGGGVDVLLAERDYLAGADWLRLVVGFGGAAFGLRMVGEVSRSAVAASTMLVSFALLGLPLAVRWHVLDLQTHNAVLWLPIAVMAARTGLLFSCVVYLRMLYREVRRLEDSESIRARIKALVPQVRRRSVEEPKEVTPVRRRRKATVKSEGELEPKVSARGRKAVEDSADEISELPRPKKKFGIWSWRKAAKTADDSAVNDELQKSALDQPREPGEDIARVSAKVVVAKGGSGGATAAAARDGEALQDDAAAKTAQRSFFQRFKRVRSAADGDAAEQQDAAGDSSKEITAKAKREKPARQAKADPSDSTSSKKGWFGFGGKSRAATEDGDKDRSDNLAAAVSNDKANRKTAEATEKVPQKSSAPTASTKPSSMASGSTATSSQSPKQQGPVRMAQPPAQKTAAPTTPAQPPAAQPPAAQSTGKQPQPANSSHNKQNQMDDDDQDDDIEMRPGEEDLDPDSIDWTSLNKSERRRMRKLLKRQGKAA